MQFNRTSFLLSFKKSDKKISDSNVSLFFLIFLSIAIILLDSQRLIQSSTIRLKVINIFFYSADLIMSGLPDLSKFNKYFISKKTLILENSVLQEQLEQHDFWKLQSRKLELENNILKKELSIAPPSNDDYITAKISMDVTTSFTKSVIVNVGENTNIQIGQAAISANGLIGSIVEVYNNYSRVLLITDINSKIPVRIGNNRVKAILSGTNKNKLELLYLKEDDVINENDEVYTSGDGGYFNSGIPIGIVKKENNKTYVDPLHNLDQLQYVQIFLNNFKNF